MRAPKVVTPVRTSRYVGLLCLVVMTCNGCGANSSTSGSQSTPSSSAPSSSQTDPNRVPLTITQVQSLGHAVLVVTKAADRFHTADKHCVGQLTSASDAGYASCIRSSAAAEHAAAARSLQLTDKAVSSLRESGQLGGNCAGLLVAYQKATRRLVSGSAQLAAAARSGDDIGAFKDERGIYPIMTRWALSARPLPVGCNLVLL